MIKTPDKPYLVQVLQAESNETSYWKCTHCGWTSPQGESREAAEDLFLTHSCEEHRVHSVASRLHKPKN